MKAIHKRRVERLEATAGKGGRVIHIISGHYEKTSEQMRAEAGLESKAGDMVVHLLDFDENSRATPAVLRSAHGGAR